MLVSFMEALSSRGELNDSDKEQAEEACRRKPTWGYDGLWNYYDVIEEDMAID